MIPTALNHNTTLQGTTKTAKNAKMVSVNGGRLLEMVAARSKLEIVLRSGCFHPTYKEVALLWHSCSNIYRSGSAMAQLLQHLKKWLWYGRVVAK